MKTGLERGVLERTSGKQRGPGKDQWKAKRSWKGPKSHPSFGKDLGMGGGKGGARHEAKPWVDVGLLYKCLEKHQKLLADMKAYEHVSSQAAPNAKALLDLKDLWAGLLELSPQGSIHSQPLRQALISLLTTIPDLNSGKHSGAVWANLKIERLNCMLKHVRQLGRSTNASGPAVCQLTRLEYQSLLEGLEKLQTAPGPNADPGDAEVVPENPGAEHVEQEEEEQRPGKAKRKFKAYDSEISLDSSGLPAIFRSPLGKEASLKKPAASPQLANRRPGSRLHEAMGYGLEKPKPGKAKAKAVMKKPAAKFGKVLTRGTQPGHRQEWEKLIQTHGTNPERSYIQGNVKGGSKHLIVQAHQSPHYKAIIGKIREALEKDSLTKEEALEMRADLLSRYGSK